MERVTAPAATCAEAGTTYRPELQVDVRRTLAPLRRGACDPTHRVTGDGAVWRTTLLPGGAATYRIVQHGPHEIRCQAWGPGAQEAVAWLPELLGAGRPAEGFDARHPLLVDTAARHPGLRIPRTGRVVEALVPAVLEQKVTGRQARESFRRLVLRFGAPAPGPAPDGMRVPPSAQTWRRVPSWEWHLAGVGPQRSRTICLAMQSADRLEQVVGLSPAAAAARLSALPGIGAWTVAEVAQRALGDSDAVSVGDYHLSQYVGWALAGRPLDDDGMLELLEQWRPHRYRVVRLLECSGYAKPRFGPRLTIEDHRAR